MGTKSIWIFFLCCAVGPIFSQEADSKIIINVDQGTHTISRHIYGHFAEHLGRCVYGGFT